MSARWDRDANPLILLDIDGVLNCQGSIRLQDGPAGAIAPVLALNLVDLCHRYDARILISSSWILHDHGSREGYRRALKAFRSHRLHQLVVGHAPRCKERVERVWSALMMWEPRVWLVLDDDGKLAQTVPDEHMIKTCGFSREGGFNHFKFNEACLKLNRQIERITAVRKR